MKKVFLVILLLVSLVAFASCGGAPESEDKNFTDIVFEDKTIDYDGNSYTIYASGAPAGATVEYSNEGPYKLPGVYEIGVSISAEGYKTYEDTATLTINALDFNGIVFESKTITYDGNAHTITATGVPVGAEVQYTNAGPHINSGIYAIGITISAEGYNTYTKTVNLVINSMAYSSVIFENKTISYDGNAHTITATGIPSGATVEYNNEGPYVLPGSYDITVVISLPNEVPYTKTVTLTINPLSFSSVVFENKAVNYSGEQHTITATGVPSGANVQYNNAGPYVNANTYDITVTISAPGYETFTKTVQLTINKIDFPSSIKFENKKVTANGDEKSILISGELPENTQIIYNNNKGTEIGQYYASATLRNPNYNDKTLYATLTIIKNVLNVALNTIDAVLDRPEPWSFMPEAFSQDALACETNPTKDFTNFVNVSSINNKYMGKQMYILWEGIYEMNKMLSKLDAVYAVSETIVTVYQNFINDNPEDYSEWSDTVAGFKIKIILNDNQVTMLVGNNDIALELFADSENNVNKGRLEILGGAILNYENSDNYLKFNLALTIKGVMVMKQVEFARNSNTVTGYYHQYVGAKSIAKKTSAVVLFDNNYAIVMSTIRESEDLLVKGYEEVYNSKTGEFISARVVENILLDFETYWVDLSDVSGINNVKAIENGKTSLNENIHDIYVNDSSKIFVAKKNLNRSRKYDIEMKTVYYVVKTIEGSDINYSVVETEIPMLFVQEKNIEDFSEEIVDANNDTFTTTPTLPTSKMDVAKTNFDTLQNQLNDIKEVLTYDELVSSLGTKNEFFNS